MKYSVLWTPAAKQQLAELWLSAEDLNKVQRAGDEINRILSEDALMLVSRAFRTFELLCSRRWPHISMFMKRIVA